MQSLVRLLARNYVGKTVSKLVEQTPVHDERLGIARAAANPMFNDIRFELCDAGDDAFVSLEIGGLIASGTTAAPRALIPFQ